MTRDYLFFKIFIGSFFMNYLFLIIIYLSIPNKKDENLNFIVLLLHSWLWSDIFIFKIYVLRPIIIFTPILDKLNTFMTDNLNPLIIINVPKFNLLKMMSVCNILFYRRSIVWLSIWLSVCPSNCWRNVHVTVCMSVYMFDCQCDCLYVCLFVWLFMWLSVCLSICLIVHVTVCLLVWLSM